MRPGMCTPRHPLPPNFPIYAHARRLCSEGCRGVHPLLKMKVSRHSDPHLKSRIVPCHRPRTTSGPRRQRTTTWTVSRSTMTDVLPLEETRKPLVTEYMMGTTRTYARRT